MKKKERTEIVGTEFIHSNNTDLFNIKTGYKLLERELSMLISGVTVS